MATTRRVLGSAPEPGKSDHWEAIASIERTQERVVTILDTVSQRLSALEARSLETPTSSTVEKTERRVDDIERRLLQAARPNYQAMGFALSGIIALGALVSFGMNSKIDGYQSNFSDQVRTLKETVVSLSETFRDHTSNGHPASVISRIEANKEAIETQIKANQRELDGVVHEIDRVRDRLENLENLNSEKVGVGRFYPQPPRM